MRKPNNYKTCRDIFTFLMFAQVTTLYAAESLDSASQKDTLPLTSQILDAESAVTNKIQLSTLKNLEKKMLIILIF
jgi:hypothetical protein